MIKSEDKDKIRREKMSKKIKLQVLYLEVFLPIFCLFQLKFFEVKFKCIDY
jgi:hypothetical protein